MDEEKVVFHGPSSLVLYLGTFFLGTMVVLGSLAALVFLPQFRWWSLIPAGIALIYMLGVCLVNRCRIYEVTTERIRVRVGILTRRTDDLELYRVQDITFLEPLRQRIFGVGTIVIATNDATTPVLRIEAIPQAPDVREALRKHVEACRERKRVRIAELESGAGFPPPA
jgi:uncharacterized membrane protein YdbT with pleckstrin-like domain